MSATAVQIANVSGPLHPVSRSDHSLCKIFSKEICNTLNSKKGKVIGAYICVNLVCICILSVWSASTNSMALLAYTYLTVFDIFSLFTCLLTVWIKKQAPTTVFPFGYERFEVLAVFTTTVLTVLGAVFIIKESIERMIEQPEIHTGRLLVGTLLVFLFHMSVTYSVENSAFNHVMSASSSSWLQEHTADISESLCHIIPGLSKLLLPRINPLALIAFAGGGALVLVHILIDMNNYHASDTWSAVWIALMIVGTMFPMSAYSGKMLLQTTPSHMTGQLDKVLREASTLDGVLEFRHEHFWTHSFGKMVGTVHVRIRRDADAQLVLAHVVNRLSNLISILTVQIFKDDWSRTSAYQIISDTSLMTKKPSSSSNPILPSSHMRLPMNGIDTINMLGKMYRPPESMGHNPSQTISSSSWQSTSQTRYQTTN